MKHTGSVTDEQSSVLSNCGKSADAQKDKT